MPEKNETDVSVRNIQIEVLEEGFLYTVTGKPPKQKGNDMPHWVEPKRYPMQSVEEVLDAVKDDLGTPHVKKEGYERSVKSLKKDPNVRNPFALAHRIQKGRGE